VYDLMRSLLARDVHVTLIAPPPAPDRPADARADAVLRHPNLTLTHVPYTTFPFANRRGTTILDRSTAYPVFGLRAGGRAAQLVAANKIDIVHGLGASALGYAFSADNAASRAPLVFNPQGMEEFGATDPSRAPLKRLGYWPLRLAVRRTARAAERIIATDRSLVEPLKTHLDVGSDVVRVIPNAIELAECDRPESADRALSLRERIGAAADDPVLVSVGRLEANKGFDVLIDALAKLDQARALPQRLRWVLVGDGPMRDSLSRRLSAIGLASRSVMWGRADQADLHGWYETATVFVHPTLYEGSSLVTLEAMAHHRAVIATRAGGLQDKVRPGINGWLVEPGDVDGLARAIRDAIENGTRLKTMGEASRELVEREFSWTVAAEKTLQVYEELLTCRNSL
jgi:glycosyltransferase involved in cell wall biosynthesis